MEVVCRGGAAEVTALVPLLVTYGRFGKMSHHRFHLLPRTSTRTGYWLLGTVICYLLSVFR
jgi:hypothetical protein